MRGRAVICLVLFAALSACESLAQRNPSRSFFGRGYATDPIDYAAGRGRVPSWPLDPEVPRDCFMFARVKYRSWTQRRSFTWYTDYRDSDLNLSYRLHELTAIRADPEGIYVEITDPR